MNKGKENELKPLHLWIPDEAQLKIPMRWSRLLGRVALVLWLISLALPGLVYDHQTGYGWEILMMGWLGPLQLIFGWYANPFFLYAARQLLRKRGAPIFSSAIATTMAFTIFPYALFSRGHSGYYTDLYGFGFGALIWLIAILLLMIAAGLRRMEMLAEPPVLDNLMREPLVRWGYLLLFLMLGAFAYLGITDRLQAGETERRYLKEVIYKVGPVCEVPDVKPQNRIALVGPLEIIGGVSYSARLANPRDLLFWGVPKVRMNGYDYTLRDRSDRSSTMAVPATGPAGARLEVAHGSQNGRVTIQARLVSADGKTVGFEGEWMKPTSKERFHCPGYFTWPDANEPPRSLLLATLTHADGSPLMAKAPRKGQKDEWLEDVEVLSERPIQRAEVMENAGCSPGVGLHRYAREEADNTLPKAVWQQLAGNPQALFQIGEQLHYGWHGYNPRAVCAQDAAYIYRGRRWNDEAELFLEKHHLADFQPAWEKDKNIRFLKPASLPKGEKLDFYVTSLWEGWGTLRLTVAVFEQGSDEGVAMKVVVGVENL